MKYLKYTFLALILAFAFSAGIASASYTYQDQLVQIYQEQHVKPVCVVGTMSITPLLQCRAKVQAYNKQEEIWLKVQEFFHKIQRMRYEFGKTYSADIPQSDPLPDFDYFIPDERLNQIGLDKLFSDSFELKLKRLHAKAEAN